MPKNSETVPGGNGHDGLDGFTRLEFAVVLATVALLAAVALPALANTRPRSQRAVCFNNLGRIGQAFAMQATERGGLYSWPTITTGGGTIGQPGLLGNVWFQFAWLSNELTTPKILACPSDGSRRPASDFSLSPDGGFLHVNFRNNAVSYILGHPFLQEGRGVLSGDRNFVPNGGAGASCPYFGNAWQIYNQAIGVTWTTNIHVNTGNVLFNDGAVEQTDGAGLRAAFANPSLNNASVHLIFPGSPGN